MNTPSLTEFFGWQRHPFADTYILPKPFLSEPEKRIFQSANELLSCGKSFALSGRSGIGKSTLIQHLTNNLDRNHYQSTYIHYGGLKRNGILNAIADALGVDAGGRSVPLLIKLQKYIQNLRAQSGGPYPVFIIDDAQFLERESMMDLCSLMVCPEKKIAASSIILIGDESLQKKIMLQAMASVRTRLTAIYTMEGLSDDETEKFMSFRLNMAKAPADLFDHDVYDLIGAHCRGNRRTIMNTATLLLNEASLRQEKTVGAQVFLNCELIHSSG